MVRNLLLFIGLLLQTAVWGAENSTDISVWLTSSLYGNDNAVAALKKVEIYRSKESYRIYVRNQFGFDCELTFDSIGNPASLANCVSREKASPVCNPNMPDSPCAVSHNCFRQPNETNPACFYQWRVSESVVPLGCMKTKSEHICKGQYTLTDTRGYSDPSEFTIARHLK